MRRTDCCKYRRNRQLGTQVVELALVLPLLAFLALVVSEGAGFVRMHQVINNAAREGARLAAQPENNPANGSVTADLQQAVSQYACNNGVVLIAGTTGTTPAFGGTCPANVIPCMNATVTINQANTVTTPSGSTMGASSVVVQCGYKLTYLPKLPFFNVAPTVNLQGSAEFRNLY